MSETAAGATTSASESNFVVAETVNEPNPLLDKSYDSMGS
jgi:hypothetical protein